MLNDFSFGFGTCSAETFPSRELEQELRFHRERQLEKYMQSGLGEIRSAAAGTSWSLAGLSR